MKYILAVLIFSSVQPALADYLDQKKHSLVLPRFHGPALLKRSLNNPSVLHKRTPPLQQRGACSSTGHCGRAAKVKSNGAGTEIHQLHQPQQRQESASSPVAIPPRPPTMERLPAAGSPSRTGSQPSSPTSPKTETLIHSDRSTQYDSGSAQSSPREALMSPRNRPASSSSFETWLSRSSGSRPLPEPHPIPVSMDATGRIMPKRGP